MDILERMATGDLSLEAEWQDVRAEIERMETRVKNKTLSIRWGHKGTSRFKTIVLDSGNHSGLAAVGLMAHKE